jgi:hypothetical protein
VLDYMTTVHDIYNTFDYLDGWNERKSQRDPTEGGKCG